MRTCYRLAIIQLIWVYCKVTLFSLFNSEFLYHTSSINSTFLGKTFHLFSLFSSIYKLKLVQHRRLFVNFPHIEMIRFASILLTFYACIAYASRDRRGISVFYLSYVSIFFCVCSSWVAKHLSVSARIQSNLDLRNNINLP